MFGAFGIWGIMFWAFRVEGFYLGSLSIRVFVWGLQDLGVRVCVWGLRDLGFCLGPLEIWFLVSGLQGLRFLGGGLQG